MGRSKNPEREEEIKRKVIAHSITHSHSFSDIVQRGVTLEEAQEIAKRYYPVNLAFPLFLAAAISHTKYDVARILLVDNLYEEHGGGRLEDSHTRLFEHFIRATGLDPRKCATAQPQTPEQELVDTYNKFCFMGGEHQSLAVLYAFEELFSPISEAISDGLKKSSILPEKDFTFFPIHGIADVEHAQKLKAALLAVVNTDQKWNEALEAAEAGAKTLFNLFDSIGRK